MDIIIPTIEQDLKILDKTVQSLEENVLDGVDNIYVVSPLNNVIKKFAKANGLVFVDEKTLMGFGKNILFFLYKFYYIKYIHLYIHNSHYY